ncbi:hypothetical protein CNEO2_480016 [Clostridium neonatale]|nr:hypothetical protein CNEO2_350016 [Clostridium neonatale]CAI3211216.1 hypothetical protein CNEO2_480016 [Clostridium neonatale]
MRDNSKYKTLVKYASEVLANTNEGLTGSEIIKLNIKTIM